MPGPDSGWREEERWLIRVLACLGWLTSLAMAATVCADPGELDTRFAGDGLLTTPIPGNAQAAARAIVRLPHGKLLVAGTAGDGTTFAVVLVRFLTDGTVDGTFGTSGVVTLDLGGGVASGPVGLVRRADGTLIVAATLLTAGSGDFVVARLDEAGALDATFGVAGKRVVDLGGDDRVAALALDDTERVVVAGRGGPAGDFAVARLTAAGAPDMSFSGDGEVTTDASGAGHGSAARAVALDGDGRVIAVGEAGNGTDLDVALVVYDDAGVPDPAFDEDGIVVTSLGTEDFSTNNDVATSALVLPGNEILVAGHRHELGFFRIVLARYDTTGELVDGFGDGGVVIAPIQGGEGQTANVVLREPGGRFVTAGHYVSSQIAGIRFPVMARFEADGMLDESFGTGGVTYYSPTSGPFTIDDVHAMVRDSYGRFMTAGIAGVFGTSTSSFGLARLVGDGPCAGGAETGCLASTGPERNALHLVAPEAGEDRLVWRWRRGEETLLEDLGDPLEIDDYELCVVDGSGARVASARAPTGTCAGQPCWKTRPDGFKYRDVERTPDGVATLRLVAGADGAASIRIAARGANLLLPEMPLTLPVTVQLHASNGVCWEAVYEANGVLRNDGARFAARGIR